MSLCHRKLKDSVSVKHFYYNVSRLATKLVVAAIPPFFKLKFKSNKRHKQ